MYLTKDQAKRVNYYLEAAAGSDPHLAISALRDLLLLIQSSIVIDDLGNKFIEAEGEDLFEFKAMQIAAALFSADEDGE